jgi:hypothetical protein
MSKTPFSKRVEILCDFYINYSEDESLEKGWKEYFSLFDIGLPLSFMAQVGIAEPTEKGKEYIDKAWEAYCKNLGIDLEANYESIKETFDVAREDEPNYLSEE